MVKRVDIEASRVPAQRPRRLLIVEERLRDSKGHYLNLVKGIVESHLESGGEVSVLCHNEMNPLLLPGAVVEGVFHRSWLELHLRPCRGWRRWLNCLCQNLYFYRTVKRFIAKGDRWDCIIAPHALMYNLLGWRLLMIRNSHLGNVLINLAQQLGVFGYNNSGELYFHRSGVVLQCLLGTFSPLVRSGKCRFVAETDHDAAVISNWCGLPVETLPTPRPRQLLDVFRTAQSAGIQKRKSFECLGWLGRFSEDKAVDVFLGAVQLVLERTPEGGPVFLIQSFCEGDNNPNWFQRLETLSGVFPGRIEIIDRALGLQDYGQALAKIDALILPYRQVDYLGRNSSAALDAFFCGIPIITTEGTWMAESMNKWGAGLTFSDGDSQALAEAMRRFLIESHSFKQRAQEKVPCALLDNSWERFWEVAWF